MKRKLAKIMLLSGSLLCLSEPVTEAGIVSELYQKMLLNNYEIKAAKHELSASLEKKNQALSQLLPSIYLTGRYSNYDTNIYGNYSTKEYGLTLKQPLLYLENIYNLDQSKVIAEASKINYETIEQNIALKFLEQYVNVIYNLNNIKIITSTLEILQTQKKQIEKLYESGVTTITNIHDINAEIEKKRYELIKEQNNYNLNMIKLSALVGDEIKEIACAEDIKLEQFDIKTKEYWIEQIKNHNKLYNYYQKRQENAMLDVKKVKTQFYPTIDLTLGYSITDTNAYLRYPETRYKTAAISLSLPLFNGGYSISKLRELKEYHFKTIAETNNIEDSIKNSINETYQDLINIKHQERSLTFTEKAYEISLESNKKTYNAGLTTFVDLINAINNLNATRLNINSIKYNFILQYYRLKAHAGLLNISDFESLDSIFTKKCDKEKLDDKNASYSK